MAIEMEENLALLRKTTLFSQLSDENLAVLSKAMVEKKFPAHERIITEGEPAPYFYVICSGNVEVSKLQKNNPVILAVLAEGDCIGLINPQEIEAPASASMKALGDVKTLSITKVALLQYLKNHPETSQQLNELAQLIHKENFFRLLTPFKKLPVEDVKSLANKITEKKVTKGEIIIKQGEEGQDCYLIVSGKVNIYTESRGATPIATLEPGQIFGEMALLSESHTKRNSTAQAEEDCVLYGISEEVFKNFTHSNRQTEEIVMFLNKNRSRPIKKNNIIISKYEYTDGEVGYILKNPENNKYFKTSEEGLFLFNLLDGDKTLHDLTLLLYEQKGIFMPEQVGNLLLSFHELGMVRGFTTLEKPVYRSFAGKIFGLLKNLMEMKYTFKQADAFVTGVYNKAAKFIFFKPALIIIGILIILGPILYAINAPHIVSFFNAGHGKYWWLLATFPLSLLTVTTHELAHAYTCKHFKREVHGFGFGWYWISAIAFCDTTDMWLATRRERIFVAMAGCLNDLVLAGIVAILAFFIPPPFSIIFWLYATVTYLTFTFNLNPILEFDGYYMLMDSFDMPHLREDAINWLIGLPKSFLRNQHSKKILLYWGACLFYIAMNVIVVMLFQKWVIFQLLPYKISQGNQQIIRWILPFLVMFFAGLTVWNEIKRKKYTAIAK